LVPMMNRFRSLGVLYKCIVAPPPAMLQFMKLHFDFNALVACLNHGIVGYAAEAALSKALLVFNTRLTVSSSSSGRKGFGTHCKPP